MNSSPSQGLFFTVSLIIDFVGPSLSMKVVGLFKPRICERLLVNLLLL